MKTSLMQSNLPAALAFCLSAASAVAQNQTGETNTWFRKAAEQRAAAPTAQHYHGGLALDYCRQLTLASGLALTTAALAPDLGESTGSFDRQLTLAPADASSSGGGGAGDDEQAQAAELAKKLQNPVASLISVPIQNNWDFGYGAANAMRYTANIQPVVPFSLGQDWNLITRTIVPVIYAESPVPGGRDKFGLGDTLQSFFFSPKEPVGGWIVAGGPVLYYPTGTDGLSARKWGAGPTALALRQTKGWTYGLLANHLWSYAGGGDAEINATFLQPFVSYTTKKFTTFGLNTETTYDWANHQWTVPINPFISQLVRFGKQPVSFSLGARLYAEAPQGGPDWGLRFAITFLFPK